MLNYEIDVNICKILSQSRKHFCYAAKPMKMVAILNWVLEILNNSNQSKLVLIVINTNLDWFELFKISSTQFNYLFM